MDLERGQFSMYDLLSLLSDRHQAPKEREKFARYMGQVGTLLDGLKDSVPAKSQDVVRELEALVATATSAVNTCEARGFVFSMLYLRSDQAWLESIKGDVQRLLPVLQTSVAASGMRSVSEAIPDPHPHAEAGAVGSTQPAENLTHICIASEAAEKPATACSRACRTAGHSGHSESEPTITEDTNASEAVAGKPRSMQSPAEERKSLEAELKLMHENGERFYRDYCVLDPQQRREGGQGLVQFMTRQHKYDEQPVPVAVKFFLTQGAFDAEMQLYQESGLSTVMPDKFACVRAGKAHSARPYFFPPYIVMRRGQSLKEWFDETMLRRPQLPTVFDALFHIVRKLEELHAKGWAHRDLKPGNILRLPHTHTWTLMDFGCATRIGQELSGSKAITTLAYSPPEAALAKRHRSPSFAVNAAADMWALGMIAFELLTGDRLFLGESAEHVEDRLCGGQPLPWEGSGKESERLKKLLKGLRDTVLACLHRDPQHRPSAAEVRRAWKGIIDDSNTTTA